MFLFIFLLAEIERDWEIALSAHPKLGCGQTSSLRHSAREAAQIAQSDTCCWHELGVGCILIGIEPIVIIGRKALEWARGCEKICFPDFVVLLLVACMVQFEGDRASFLFSNILYGRRKRLVQVRRLVLVLL